MNKQLRSKLKEACFSVLPITLIVIILNFTNMISLDGFEIGLWIVGSIFLILGIGLFALGADIAMMPMGEHVGSGLLKKKKIALLIISVFLLGMLITMAEPDLSVLAGQVPIDSMTLIILIAVGVGLFLVIGILRTVFKFKLNILFIIFYGLIFILAIFAEKQLLPLAFDSGGVTTGPITVPFIMALGLGIANVKGDSNDSFGLVALSSIGPILMVMILGIFIKGQPLSYDRELIPMEPTIMKQMFHSMGPYFGTVATALAPIIIFFLLINFIFLKLPKKKIIKILIGIVYTYLGLVIFLSAVEASFMPIADKIGKSIANLPYNWVIIPIGLVIGVVTVLAEPAVHVLNKQVETISQGLITKKSMLFTLAVGVGVAIALSMIRILLGFSIMWYMTIGYGIALILTFFVPKIYTAIAFDSGGVVSGPITAGFILPFAIGAAETIMGTENILNYAFGIVAMVAMTPLIAIQVLGLIAKIKEQRRRQPKNKLELLPDDATIIYFDED